MTDANDYAREPNGPKRWPKFETRPHGVCMGLSHLAGHFLTEGKSLPLYHCPTCKRMWSAPLDDVRLIRGMILRGQIHKLKWTQDGTELKGEFVPVAHPDDVWG